MKEKILLLIVTIFVFISCTEEEPNEILIKEKPIILPILNTYNTSHLTLFSVVLGGKILDEGLSPVTEQGLVIGNSTNPSVENNINKLNLPINDKNEFSIEVISLTPNTIYYIRSYGINDEGVGYGNEVQFTTLDEKIYDGNITLSTQEEVKEFGSNNYNTITGRLFIEGSVSDLKPLNKLVFVDQNIEVRNTTILKNFEGLQNLKHIGSSLKIINNRSLDNFQGFNNLREIFQIDITSNSKIRNFDGFDSLNKVNYFWISSNENLENFQGLEYLEMIIDHFGIVLNPKLLNFNGLNNLLIDVGTFQVSINNSLKNFNGLDKIRNIRRLVVIDNDVLEDLNGLVELEYLNKLEIKGNKKLVKLPHFDKISNINYILLLNGSFSNLNGFENLKSVGAFDLYNSNVKNLIGLDNLEEIDKLTISRCENIIDLEGLSKITSIGEGYASSGLTLIENPNLQNLNGLQNLTQINGSLRMSNNNSMVNLFGLESLITIKDNLFIESQDNLSNINDISNLESLNGFTIIGNDNLTQLPQFIKLKYLDNLGIMYGGVLKNLKGLENIETIGYLYLTQTSIESFEGLDNLEIIERLINIESCDNLIDFKGLGNVKSIGTGSENQGIKITGSSKIINFNGLNSLTNLNGTLYLYQNKSFLNLDGLESVTNIEKGIEIYLNELLSDFCSLYSFFSNYQFNGNYRVEKNKFNPTIQEIKDGNCN